MLLLQAGQQHGDAGGAGAVSTRRELYSECTTLGVIVEEEQYPSDQSAPLDQVD